MKTCVIRTDSGRQIGVGHVSRCLTLAVALRRRGWTVHFICRAHPGAAFAWICREGFRLHVLSGDSLIQTPEPSAGWLGVPWQQDATETGLIIESELGVIDVLVVDHYAIGADWEHSLRNVTARILVIDDLADRVHDCDVLVDQSLRDGDPYCELLPPYAKRLLGPRFALLRDEFRELREGLAPRGGVLNKLVVFFGGTDPTGETLKALDALRIWQPVNVQVAVIVGEGNPAKEVVAQRCGALPWVSYHCQVSDMARFFAEADVALGAGGVTSWERLSLGLPALVVAVAGNQVENMRQLEHCGVAVALGEHDQVNAAGMAAALQVLASNPERIRTMSEQAFSIVDGRGVERVADVLTDGAA